MFGELLDLRLLAPGHDIRGRDGVDAERLAGTVDRFLFGVHQMKPDEAVMPLGPRDEVGHPVRGWCRRRASIAESTTKICADSA